MSEMKKKVSKLQTKKQVASGNDDSEYSSHDEQESFDESPVRIRKPPSKPKVKTEQIDDIAPQPQDATRRRRRGRGTRSRPSRSRSQSRRRGRRSSRSRRRR